jgi:glycine oxidase
MDDVLIIGGGVIGLSLAYELAGAGTQVRLIERGLPGQEASWAGAGILPSGNRSTAENAYDELVGLSHELHPRWAAALREETGLDNGYRRCGGLYVARSAQDAEELLQTNRWWQRHQIAVEHIAPEDLCTREPALNASPFHAASFLPDEAQLRNPWHLKALLAACQKRGVQVDTETCAEDVEVRRGRIVGLRTHAGQLTAGRYCICGGAWSRALLSRLDIELPLKPIRGQIVLLSMPQPPLRHIVNEGSRYLVPRYDGHVLVGSTEEDAGFDKRTTAEAVQGLLHFALELVPSLGEASVERTWAGLRPGTTDGLPFLGPIPGVSNAFIAAGHFRSGLQMSPGTAVVMAQLLRGQPPEIDLSPFRVERVQEK